MKVVGQLGRWMTSMDLDVSGLNRASLERLARSSSARHRTVQQARALFFAAEGVTDNEIGQPVGVTANSVRAWWARSADKRLAGFGAIALPAGGATRGFPRGRWRLPRLPLPKSHARRRITPADSSTTTQSTVRYPEGGNAGD